MRTLAELRDPSALLLAVAAAVTLLAFQEGLLVALLAAVSVLVVRTAARPLADRLIPLPPAPPAPPPGQPWYYPLTRRESEVALLLSEGLTHREIGERLHSDRTVDGHLSERSVDTNVQNIMNKLNMNRAPQISAWVAERRPRGPVSKV
ncbi:MAG: LuxR C-terminal-related transcriptional regulator [Chloroflexota bacterium]|nr:LuxR C-terminal-related transcriptional regulator [Chloroflexota bacterium]